MWNDGYLSGQLAHWGQGGHWHLQKHRVHAVAWRRGLQQSLGRRLDFLYWRLFALDLIELRLICKISELCQNLWKKYWINFTGSYIEKKKNRKHCGDPAKEKQTQWRRRWWRRDRIQGRPSYYYTSLWLTRHADIWIQPDVYFALTTGLRAVF